MKHLIDASFPLYNSKRSGNAYFCTHEHNVIYPTVRKDLTQRLQFRFFNMNHRKPALIQ